MLEKEFQWFFSGFADFLRRGQAGISDSDGDVGSTCIRDFHTERTCGLSWCEGTVPVFEVKINESVQPAEINADEALTERGFQKFKDMKDKEWGFVDCISMVVAKKIGNY